MGSTYRIVNDFEFPKEFGFSKSASGTQNPQAHPTQDQDEYGDGSYLSRQSQTVTRARGGALSMKPRRVPMAKAQQAAKIAGALGAAVGKRIGAQQAVGALTAPRPMGPVGAAGAPPMGAPAAGALPMKKGGQFIQKAIKHPGRMTELAKRHGVSLGEEIAKDVHSPDRSLRSAAILGRRFRSGDLSSKKKG